MNELVGADNVPLPLWCANGCDKPPYRRGLCAACVYAERRANNPPCTIDGCERWQENRRTGLCGTHYARLRRYGHTGLNGPHREDDRLITYRGMHLRLTRIKGRASDLDCADCGRPARDWAYNHSGISERWEFVTGYLLPFSTDPDQYDALCRSCHVRKDRAA